MYNISHTDKKLQTKEHTDNDYKLMDNVNTRTERHRTDLKHKNGVNVCCMSDVESELEFAACPSLVQI